MPVISGILETCLYVEDITTAESFYSRLLVQPCFAKEDNRHVFFRIGSTMLLLFNPVETIKPSQVPSHGSTGSGHVAFHIERRDLQTWREHLKTLNIVVEKEVKWPSGGYSIYFRDPFENSLELATYDVWQS